MTLTLHDYQLVGRDYLRGRDRAALMMDMGLGKTATSLAAIEPRHLPVLVTAPKRVAEHVWEEERDLWRPDLTIAVAKGDPAARAAALSSGADIVVIGRDNLRDVPAKHPFRTFIVDELSGFKTRSSVRWRAARRIAAKLPHVWGLTGTPASNGYLDLCGQIALLDNGERLGNLTTYKSRYFTEGRRIQNGIVVEWLLKPGADLRIKERIADICLAMGTDGRITLPKVTYNDMKHDLPPTVRKAYREFESQLIVDLREIFGGEIHTAANAAALTSRLSQMTAGFVFVDEAELNDGRYTRLHTERLALLREIVEGTDSPILVFYRFVPEREMIKEAFPEARTIDEPGVIPEWNRGKVPLLLAHPASAGHGLNLQHGGHTMVWVSPTWDLEHWEQGVKRLVRQGQKHPVVIHTLLANKTIDYKIRQRLTDKRTVQGDFLAYMESPV